MELAKHFYDELGRLKEAGSTLLTTTNIPCATLEVADNEIRCGSCDVPALQALFPILDEIQ